MKKILMTMVAAFAAVSMNAQVYVGGELGFTSSKVNGGDSKTSFKILPEIGYNLDETMSLGIVLGYEQGNATESFEAYAVNDKAKSFIINPYLRYNVLKAGNVTFFGDLSVLYKNQDEDRGYKVNTFGVGLKPGIAVALSDKFSFVSHIGFLGWQQSKADSDGAKASSSIGLDLKNNLTFGLYYNF